LKCGFAGFTDFVANAQNQMVRMVRMVRLFQKSKIKITRLRGYAAKLFLGARIYTLKLQQS
jgi:hypothetical protein